MRVLYCVCTLDDDVEELSMVMSSCCSAPVVCWLYICFKWLIILINKTACKCKMMWSCDKFFSCFIQVKILEHYLLSFRTFSSSIQYLISERRNWWPKTHASGERCRCQESSVRHLSNLLMYASFFLCDVLGHYEITLSVYGTCNSSVPTCILYW